VSDSFEHSFVNAGQLYARAEGVVKKLAECLRMAVFNLAELEPETIKQLTSAPYDHPRGPRGIEHYFWGTLSKETPDDLSTVATYPHFGIEGDIEILQGDTETEVPGLPPLISRFKCTPRTEPGYTLELKVVEAWDGATMTSPTVLRSEIVLRQAAEADRPAPSE